MKHLTKTIMLLLCLLGGVNSVNAQEVDVTTLDWVQKGQGRTLDFDNPNGSTVFGTDAGGANLSYVDISDYGTIKLYGTAGQRARLFINREEIGDKGIIFVDLDENGVGVYDCSKLLELQPTIQYIHLNGVKASAHNTTLNLSSITVSGDPIDFPEDIWVCPEGETDVTKLAWTQNSQGCTNNLGILTDATVWGTDAGSTNISYVDLSAYGSIKVYGPAGQRARFFINREEYASGTYQFYADIDENGVGVLNLDDVYAAQEGAEYIHLNGIKGASYGAKLQLDGVTVVEKPWTCPASEVNYTNLEGWKDVNNIGKALNGGDVVYGDQSNGDNYTDVTAFDQVKFYGTPGAMLRIFANRAGGEGVTVGANEQRVTIDGDGVGILDVKDVMTATDKDYCRLSGIKICAKWQGASVDAGIVIKGITVYKTIAQDILDNVNTTFIDATGITGTGVELTTANPNCIIKANADVLSNDKNVMVGTTIANLALTDGYDFAVPAGATATAASYDRTFTADYSTVCLPFNATFTGKAYECTAISNETVTFTEVDAIEAGKAYLVENGFAVTGGNGTLAEAAEEDFKGTYAAVKAPMGAFGFSGGKFVKITGTEVNCGAFRAYLTASAGAPARLNVNFDTPTSINALIGELNTTAVVYNEAGVRQTSLQKGMNIVKLANGKTQKVIIK